MDNYESKSYAYDLEDVLKNKLDYAYDIEMLWKYAENKKIIKYKINDIKHWIYIPCWSNKNCIISIFQVLCQKDNFPEHMNRIKKANTNYPIIIIEDKYDKFGTILDGNHRFAKAILENKRIIDVIYLTKAEANKLKIKL